jgi:hypothetical protein
MTRSPAPLRWMLAISLVFIGYAVLRYHVFQGESWSRLPLWTLNKAAAMTSLAMFAMALVIGVRKGSPEARFSAAAMGRLGFHLALGHSIASIVLFRPVEFPRFFHQSGALTFSTVYSITAGLIALLLFRKLAGGAGSDDASTARRGMVRLALVLTAIHTFGLGWFVWLEPSRWPNGLVPLTLIGVCMAAVATLVSFRVAGDANRP